MVAAQATDKTQMALQWALVERVLASQQFRRTVRLRDFLRYVAARSIDHPGTPVREQEVGTAVFQRPPDYDTGIDNIVRVSAGDLRRRVEHYFLDEGLAEPVVFEMPRGGYTLLFRERTPAGDLPDATAQGGVGVAPAGRVPASDAAALATAAAPPHPQVPHDTDGTNAAEPPAPAVHPTLSGWLLDRRTVALLTLCLALAVTAGVSLFRRGREPWQQSGPLRQVWAGFFVPDTQTEVVLADSSFAVIRSLTHIPVSLPDYLNYRYREAGNDPRLDGSTQAAVNTLLARNTGSIGDFEAARAILALTRQPGQVVLGSAHDFTPAVIKRSNVVLLGGSQSNPWVDLYRGERTLLIEQNPADSLAVVRNLSVQPGEAAEYRTANGKGDVSGYAVVSIVPNIDPDKRVMLIEGTDSQATLAASSFIASAAGAQALADRLHGGPMPRHLEILLQSSKLLATALDASIVTVHTR